jgi:hypothetical protein
MRKRLSATRPLQVNEPKQGAKLDLQMQWGAQPHTD